ncbi:MAG: tetratricopeptide repeat protein, partial [Armatimonadetes bacterium]|nr:tetratricopeptide repeat protein [Armatimonadota bacterium]
MGTDEGAGLSDEEFQELFDRARMALHVGHAEEGLQVAQQMVQARPQSTTAQEVLGDALRALGHLEEAEQAYRRAAELEPANADAQRKLGEVVLQRKEGDLARQLIEDRLEEKALRGWSDPEPEAAALRSALFPGLGQLYNGEYEKGGAFVIGGLVCLGLLTEGIFGLMSPTNQNPYSTTYTVIGALVGFGLYCYAIWDA